MTDHPSFSLLTEPWISCSTRSGQTALVSLRDVFAGGDDLSEVRGDSPTQDYAVLRLLLAIFWRAHASDADVSAGETFSFTTWFSQQFDSAQALEPDAVTLEYLEAHADRFDLRHPTTPFMQVADLHTQSGNTSEVARIVPEAEDTYFSMRAESGAQTLSAPEAARWLIHTHAYDYSGIKSGAVGDPRVKNNKGYPIGTGWSGMTGGTVVLGRTLRETLALNTTPAIFEAGKHDSAPWEREPDTAAPRNDSTPAGPVDLATWQSRRIRLHWTEDRVTQVLVSNGDRIPDAGANILADPMTPYRYSANKSTKSQDVFYARPYNAERMLWRSLEPLIAMGESEIDLKKGEKAPRRPLVLDSLAQVGPLALGRSRRNFELRLISASYGPQQSSAATTVDARIGFPRDLVRRDRGASRIAVFTTATCTSQAAKALGVFGAELLQAAGGDYEYQTTAANGMLGDLEGPFTQWLRDLDVDSLERCTETWARVVDAHARAQATRMLRGAGPRALIGRTITQGEQSRLLSAGGAYMAFDRRLRKALQPLRPESDRRTATQTDTAQ